MAVIYLITGATGYLGNNIIHELMTQEMKIRVLVLPRDRGIDRLSDKIEIYKGDILNNDDLQRFFNVPSDTGIIAIHAAGIVSTTWNYDRRVFEVNVRGTDNIVKQCIRTKVKKLVHVSSVHALTELPKGQTIVETNNFVPENIIGFYGKTKAEASQIVTDAFRNRGLNASLVFPSGLCGPHDYEVGYITQVLMDCANKRLPAGIKGGYDFVDVRDVAKGIISACEKGKAGEGYILSNRYISIKEILQCVQRQTNIRRIKLFLPTWVASGLLPLFTAYYKLRKKKPLYNRYSLYTLTSNSSFSNEKARRELGYTIRPFEQTIVDTLNWLKEEGKI
jgi:dihydroflavonol-4-reductase